MTTPAAAYLYVGEVGDPGLVDIQVAGEHRVAGLAAAVLGCHRAG